MRTAMSLSDNDDEVLRRARIRGSRRMVEQGLTLYYQSLVHRVHEDTPTFVDRVFEQTGSGVLSRKTRSH